jgi:hypothetical protein
MTRNRFICLLTLATACTGVCCAPQGEPPARQNVALPTAAEKDIVPIDSLAPPASTGLKDRIQAAIDNVSRRDLLTTHAFWTVFHGILGMGPDVTLLDHATGMRVNALEHICKNLTIRGMVFTPMADGVDVVTMAGSGVGQGHQDQFIAELSQWGMPLDRKFHIGGKDYTFKDFVHYSKARASLRPIDAGTRQELSWTILVLGQYYGTDIEWTNSAGEKLKYEDLLRYELNQPLDIAPCGGTHGLFDLTWVYFLHRARGGQKVGIWKDVADKLDYYKALAHKYQNPDGAFSMYYIIKPGTTDSSELRIASTGHVLEWLSLMLPARELRAPWMQDAANALALMILRHQNEPIDSGALYHAVHGLRIYRARVFNIPTPHLVIPAPPQD